MGVLGPLSLFGVLADGVVEKAVFAFDKPTLVYLHAHATPLMDSAMRFFTRAGSAFFLVPFNVVVFAVLLWRGRRWIAAFWGFAVIGAAIIMAGLLINVFGQRLSNGLRRLYA